ncbi:MAG TPA: DUF1572 family protein [Bacteroidia bacterium]
MTTSSLLPWYLRDLNKLKEEIASYKNENDLWVVKGDINNSAGNLALHLTGNLKHFIGALLGNTGYVRNRDKEFADKNIPRPTLLKEIDDMISILEKTLSGIKEEDLGKEYPAPFLGEKRTIGYLLLTLLMHLNYHLGQINYHRRLI